TGAVASSPRTRCSTTRRASGSTAPPASRKPSASSASGSVCEGAAASGSQRPRLDVPLDQAAERIDEALEERLGLLADGVPVVIEQRARVADIGLGLLQKRHVEEAQRLPQVVV